MCEIAWLPKLLIWGFAATVLVMAISSQRLNAHLRTPPSPPAGPFAVLYRLSHQMRPGFLFHPERHFDAAGQKWAKLFRRLLFLAATFLLLLPLSGSLCGWPGGASVEAAARSSFPSRD